MLADGFAPLTGLLGTSRGVWESVCDTSARFTRLFQRAADGIFCRSEVLGNSAGVFESLADVFENSADGVFCLIMSKGETVEGGGLISEQA